MSAGPRWRNAIALMQVVGGLAVAVPAPAASAQTLGADSAARATVCPNGAQGVVRPNCNLPTQGIVRPNCSLPAQGIVRPNCSLPAQGIVRPNCSLPAQGVVCPSRNPPTRTPKP